MAPTTATVAPAPAAAKPILVNIVPIAAPLFSGDAEMTAGISAKKAPASANQMDLDAFRWGMAEVETLLMYWAVVP